MGETSTIVEAFAYHTLHRWVLTSSKRLLAEGTSFTLRGQPRLGTYLRELCHEEGSNRAVVASKRAGTHIIIKITPI